MGQDYTKQLIKLRERSWARISQIEIRNPRGVPQRATVIDLRTLSGWLMSINENRVPIESRAKLIQYQAECVEALERHFLRRATPTRYRPWAERFRESFAPHSQLVLSDHPQGAFTAITEGVMTMLMLEDELIRHMMDVRPGDRPCVSIGLTWANYRRKVLHRDGGLGEAEIWLPDRNMFVPVRVYGGEELHDFKKWLHFIYLPTKLPAYLDNKPEFHRYGSLPRASVADNTCLSITGRSASLPDSTRCQLTTAGGFAPAARPSAPLPPT